jgi:hypothetical protein
MDAQKSILGLLTTRATCWSGDRWKTEIHVQTNFQTTVVPIAITIDRTLQLWPGHTAHGPSMSRPSPNGIRLPKLASRPAILLRGCHTHLIHSTIRNLRPLSDSQGATRRELAIHGIVAAWPLMVPTWFASKPQVCRARLRARDLALRGEVVAAVQIFNVANHKATKDGHLQGSSDFERIREF